MNRLQRLWRRRQQEELLEKELRFHLDEHTDDLIAQGIAPEEAHRQAQMALGGREQVKEGCRDARGTRWLDDLWQDLRYSARLLRQNPGFTLIAVFTLALGIGANTAIFSVINSVLIKALPYPQAEQLVHVWETVPNGNHNSVSAAVYKDWREYSKKFAHLALFKDIRLNLTGTGTPEHVQGTQVTTEYLSTLGVAPSLGRDFIAGEDAKGGNNQVVILSHSLWQNRFGGAANVIGQKITLNQLPYTIVGVLPPGTLLDADTQFLIPFIIDVDTETVRWIRGYHCCGVMGRVAPGSTLEQAQAELRDIRQQLAAEYPAYKKDWNLAVVPLQKDLTGDVRPTLLVLLGTVGLVLLIACANVSNLMLARGSARSREMAIRTALGASSGRIVRQLLAESVLLALLGCGLGLLLARLSISVLTKMLTGMVPQLLHPELDVTVLAFSVIVGCGCGILFGLLPALRASRPDLQSVMKESERGSASVSKRRAQSVLIVAEFAFTLVLLIGAGLFLRSFQRLLSTDPGFNPKQTLAFDLSFAKAKYPRAEEQQRFLQDLNTRLAALPGVESVGAATMLPLSNRENGDVIRRAGEQQGNIITVGNIFVNGDYFNAMGLRLQRGREITAADNLPGAPPALVIDASVARTLFADEDPVGKPVQFLNKQWEVVGVVTPVRHNSLDANPRPRIYGARGQASYPTSSIVLRSALPPAALTDSVRKTILDADRDQPIANVRTLTEAVDRSLSRQRTTLILLGLFALVAIALACIGIYGVMSYVVGQRTREFGVRVALGAQNSDILRLVFGNGMKLSLIGIAVGLLAAFLLSWLVEGLLFEVNAHDPFIFAAAVALLGLGTAGSIYFPARRATKADPMTALRAE